MENYTRRGKNILSLIVFFVVINGCSTRYKIAPPAIVEVKTDDRLLLHNKKKLMVTLVKEYKLNDSTETIFSERIFQDDFDSIVNKTTHQKISKEEKYFVISIKDFIKNYRTKNGHLSVDGQNSIIDLLRYENKENLKILSINKGELSDVLLYNWGFPVDSEGYAYDKNGNLDFLYDNLPKIYMKAKEQDTIKYKKDDEYLPLKTMFSNGTGTWRRFHYIQDENLEYIRNHTKEEGEVKNNFKYGVWKYYNKEGKIDSIKNYSLKDSVDVRFPNCIFNKNEPCY